MGLSVAASQCQRPAPGPEPTPLHGPQSAACFGGRPRRAQESVLDTLQQAARAEPPRGHTGDSVESGSPAIMVPQPLPRAAQRGVQGSRQRWAPSLSGARGSVASGGQPNPGVSRVATEPQHCRADEDVTQQSPLGPWVAARRVTRGQGLAGADCPGDSQQADDPRRGMAFPSRRSPRGCEGRGCFSE